MYRWRDKGESIGVVSNKGHCGEPEDVENDKQNQRTWSVKKMKYLGQLRFMAWVVIAEMRNTGRTDVRGGGGVMAEMMTTGSSLRAQIWTVGSWSGGLELKGEIEIEI